VGSKVTVSKPVGKLLPPIRKSVFGCIVNVLDAPTPVTEFRLMSTISVPAAGVIEMVKSPFTCMLPLISLRCVPEKTTLFKEEIATIS